MSEEKRREEPKVEEESRNEKRESEPSAELSDDSLREIKGGSGLAALIFSSCKLPDEE